MKYLLKFRLCEIIFTEERAPRQTFTCSKSTVEIKVSKKLNKDGVLLSLLLTLNIFPHENIRKPYCFKNIFFKHQISVRAFYLFQNTTCSHPFVQLLSHFIGRAELRPQFNVLRIGFCWRISLNHSYFHVGYFFTEQLQPSIPEATSCRYPFSQGLYGTDNFWQELLFQKSNLRHSIF